MSLRDDILDIQNGLRERRYDSEASVSQGIVQRILHALDWPIFDPRYAHQEYKIAGLEVDFALCSPPNKPLIFIEVKKLGEGDSEKANRQLFEYAFHSGVPMAILTDGQEWHFYLPGEQGKYQERRVYKLDLLARDVEESEFRLRRYLDFTSSRNKSNIEAATLGSLIFLLAF